MSSAAGDALRATTVVVAVKDDPRIFDCIDSVDEDVEIVLALNGTPPELRDRLAAHPRGPLLTEIGEAGNLGAAYNAGIAAARGRYILLMDSDCLFAPGAIRALAGRAAEYPVVKGRIVYGTSPRLLSRLTARVRAFDEGDYVSALSPPLVYDRRIAELIGGYHFDPLIHWCEDREFDFRLQMAGIPVLEEPRGVVYHDAQHGFDDLRSYWRYGIGEAIAQELGVFTTPAIPIAWRLLSDLRILAQCARSKGLATAAYYVLVLGAFHVGTAYHLFWDPYRVRRRYPPGARRVRMLRSIPQHCMTLSEEQKGKLRAAHARAGRSIGRGEELAALWRKVAVAPE